jgi:hypothetical protein
VKKIPLLKIFQRKKKAIKRMRMKSIRKKIYGGWNKKNTTLNIILDYKNSNKKNENQI